MSPRAQAAPSRSITVRVLQAFIVTVDGVAMADTCWRLRHARHLFQMLCLKPGQRMHRDEAIESLWPQSDAAASANRLYHTLHVLRAEFANMGLAPSEPVIMFQGGTLWLNPHHSFDIDLCRFDTLVGQCRQGPGNAASTEWLEHAAALCDQLLPEAGPPAAWLAPYRAEIRDKCVWVLERLAACQREGGRSAEAIQSLQRLVALEPCNEVAHRTLMSLFDAALQPERALLQFSACKRYLQRDLATEPSPLTLSLRDAIVAASRQPASPSGVPETAKAGSRYQPPAPSCSRLLGRAQEMAELQAWLDDPHCRLITIAASAGTGKTSLALTLAVALQARYRDGVLVVRLTQLADPARFEQWVCQAAGVSTGLDDPCKALHAHLASKDLLLVLDRFEHVVEAAACVSALVAAAPGLRVLVTSQCVLGCQAEQVLRLRQLAQSAPSAAHALFVQTAHASGAQPGQLDDQAQVARVCERLGGNALAIQLGAAQLAALSIDQLEAGVESLLDLPLAARAHDEPQHRSLSSAIGWSVSLLGVQERAVLQGLAVFEGGFTADDAHTVLGEVFGVAPVRQSMMVLIDRCLVCRDVAAPDAVSTARLILLDSIRHWLNAHIDSFAGQPAVDAAHARLFRERTLEAANLLRSGHLPRAHAMYRLAEQNIQRALDWQELRGDPVRYLEWCHRACVMQVSSGGWHTAIKRLERAVKMGTPDIESRRHAAWCYNVFSRALHWANNIPGSVHALRLCRHRSAGLSDITLREAISNHYCTLRSAQMRFRAVGLHLKMAMELRDLSQDVVRKTVLKSNNCSLMTLRGEYQTALAQAEQVFELALTTQNPFFSWWSLHLLMEANMRNGLSQRAKSCAEDCSMFKDDSFGVVLQFAAKFLHFKLHFEHADYGKAQMFLDAAFQLSSLALLPHALAVDLGAEFIMMETGRAADVEKMLSVDDSMFAFDVEFSDIYVLLHCYRLRLLAGKCRWRDALHSFTCALRPFEARATRCGCPGSSNRLPSSQTVKETMISRAPCCASANNCCSAPVSRPHFVRVQVGSGHATWWTSHRQLSTSTSTSISMPGLCLRKRRSRCRA